MKQILYHQCGFRRGAERTVAWIEQRGAIIGARVELRTLDDGPPWEVERVGATPMDEAALQDMQRLNRQSLPSILGRK